MRACCTFFSVAPAAEFVVQGGGEQIDAAIVDSNCIGAECGSRNREALGPVSNMCSPSKRIGWGYSSELSGSPELRKIAIA